MKRSQNIEQTYFNQIDFRNPYVMLIIAQGS